MKDNLEAYMRILLIIPKYNSSKNIDYTYNFPLGLAYISSTLKNSGYNVDCLNLNHLYGDVKKLITDTLDERKYEIVCTGGIALLYPVLKTIVSTVRKHETKPIIIIGGTIITSEPELMFESVTPDYAVRGEGEVTIIELLKCIENQGNFGEIDGIIFRDENNKVIITKERKPIKDVDSIPLPDFDGFEFEKQLDNTYCNQYYMYQAFDYPRVYPILGSRGCPFNCTFCWHDTKYRARSIENIIEEIEIAIKKYNINFVRLYDDCFSTNKERLYEFCSNIKQLSEKNSNNLKWSCQLLVNHVDKELLKVMKDAGCEMISYGFESFSPIVLKSMRKPISPQQIDKSFKETMNAGIGIQANFIFGDVAETKETAKTTLDYWKENCNGQIQLGLVQPYPGSDLYNHCIEKGIIKNKLDYIINHMGSDNRINMTDSMTGKEFKDLNIEILEAYSRYGSFVVPSSIRGGADKNVYEIEIQCPFCNNVITYNNCLISNKFIFSFHMICRVCHKRYIAVSTLPKIAYKYYSITRPLRDYWIYLTNRFKKKMQYSF